MAIVHGKLADIQTIPSTAGSIYANPAGAETFIAGFTLFNSNSSAETVALYSVPGSDGTLGTAGLTNQFFEVSLAAKETVFLEFPGDGIVLSATNDSIQASTTTASKVTIQIHGLKEV